MFIRLTQQNPPKNIIFISHCVQYLQHVEKMKFCTFYLTKVNLTYLAMIIMAYFTTLSLVRGFVVTLSFKTICLYPCTLPKYPDILWAGGGAMVGCESSPQQCLLSRIGFHITYMYLELGSESCCIFARTFLNFYIACAYMI